MTRPCDLRYSSDVTTPAATGWRSGRARDLDRPRGFRSALREISAKSSSSRARTHRPQRRSPVWMRRLGDSVFRENPLPAAEAAAAAIAAGGRRKIQHGRPDLKYSRRWSTRRVSDMMPTDQIGRCARPPAHVVLRSTQVVDRNDWDTPSSATQAEEPCGTAHAGDARRFMLKYQMTSPRGTPGSTPQNSYWRRQERQQAAISEATDQLRSPCSPPTGRYVEALAGLGSQLIAASELDESCACWPLLGS